MMANNDRGHHHRIKICSIDTLRARRLRPDADLIVIDEAHLATSDSYVEFLKDYPEAFLLPVTATPFGSKPLRHCANVIVSTIRSMTTSGTGVTAFTTRPDVRHGTSTEAATAMVVISFTVSRIPSRSNSSIRRTGDGFR